MPDPERASPIPVRMFAAELEPGYVVPAGQLYDHNGAVIDEDLTITEVTKQPNGLLALHVKGPMLGGGVHVGPDLSLEVHPDTYPAPERAAFLDEVMAERRRLVIKWGQPGENGAGASVWVSILTEAVGDVAKCLNDHHRQQRSEITANMPREFIRLGDVGHYKALRSTLTRVAAVTMCWVEALDANRPA